MKSFAVFSRLSLAACVVLMLSGCPSDKCKNVSCNAGQTCNASTGLCEGGGTGGSGGGSAGGNQGGGNEGGGSAGGTAGGSGGGSVAPITVAEFCTEYAKALCDGALRCLELEQADYQSCLGLQKDQCDTIQKRVTAGLYGFNGSLAASCVAATKAAVCQTLNSVDECDTAIIYGASPIGGQCSGQGECDAGYCATATGSGACRTCTAFATANQPCSTTPDVRCATGMRCVVANDAGTCRAPGPVGSACGSVLDCLSDAGYCPTAPTDGGARLCTAFVADGQPCTLSSQCASGVCPTVSDGGTRVCVAKQADGTECVTNSQCATAYCNYNSEVIDGGPGFDTCGKLANGTICARHADCTSGLCRGLRVETSGTCAMPDPSGSTTCQNEFLYQDTCANADESCIDGKCQTMPVYSRAVGLTCDDLDQCVTDAFCEFEEALEFLEGHCKARKAPNAACVDDGECAQGSFCGTDSETCQLYKKQGEDCSNDEDTCQPVAQSCKFNGDGGYTCYGLATVGGQCGAAAPTCYGSFCAVDAGMCSAKLTMGACTSSTQCESGRCSNSDGGTMDMTCQMACF